MGNGPSPDGVYTRAGMTPDGPGMAMSSTLDTGSPGGARANISFEVLRASSAVNPHIGLAPPAFATAMNFSATG